MNDPLDPLEPEVAEAPKKEVPLSLDDIYSKKRETDKDITSELKEEDPIAYDVPMRIKEGTILSLYVMANEKGRWYAYYGWGQRILHGNMISASSIPQLFDRLREFVSKEGLTDKGI